MKNLLTAKQIKDLDAYTIKNHQIKSIDLMERAANAFINVFDKKFKRKKQSIAIFCGGGNNGGDGLAIARLLFQDGFKNIKVYLVNFSAKRSDDYIVNLERLKKLDIEIAELSKADDLAELKTDLIIDAILGSGLNKQLSGDYIDLISKINNAEAKIVAVDIPTGLPSEGEIKNYNGIKSDLTITFQLPKLNFFFPESVQAQRKFNVVKIGLDTKYWTEQPSNWKLITGSKVKSIYKPRELFSHKGTYGHSLIVAGNENTMGAAILASKGCVNSGAGLTTVCLPQSGLTALNVALPEAMALTRKESFAIETLEKYNAIAAGPGLGTDTKSVLLLKKIIGLNKPLVLDADALNILSENKSLLRKLPPETILTPHLKEFDRLFGEHQTWWERVETARGKATALQNIIILKNQFTFICLPTGDVLINPTGNPAMASGGMGDVLTGIITAFKAQGYSSANAAILAVYLHGKAGDQLAKKSTFVIAEQVARRVPKTLKKLIN